jgi:hypothetical protein
MASEDTRAREHFKNGMDPVVIALPNVAKLPACRLTFPPAPTFARREPFGGTDMHLYGLQAKRG